MANVLASVAVYENEVRSERIAAGQAVARAKGKRWGGSKPGRKVKVTAEQIRCVKRRHHEETPVAAIARTVGLSRPTVYRLLHRGERENSRNDESWQSRLNRAGPCGERDRPASLAVSVVIRYPHTAQFTEQVKIISHLVAELV